MINLPDVRGQAFSVLGLGKSGLATAAALRASGAEVSLWDDNPAAREQAIAAGYTVANPTDMDISKLKALVLSPGIPLHFPKPHAAVEKCLAAGVPVIGDIELLLSAEPKARFIGVTGTNGKSTTTALIGHILHCAGMNVAAGGNLGTAALALEPLGRGGFYVLELSSYQLDLLKQHTIEVGVLLNITPDHLDRHDGMQGYVAAKARLFTMAVKPQTLVIGSGEKETRVLADEARKRHDIKVEEIESCKLDKLVDPTTLVTLPGTHNLQNARAAVLACRAVGIADDIIALGLKSFPGLPHRQQLVAEIGGVHFINDSKATNADAAGKALACYDNIYWIAGGKPKEGGLNGLENFAPRIRHAFLIGAASDEFALWCKNKVPATQCGTLDRATEAAATMAWDEKKIGAVVLLSPACASFDQFKNFEERGQSFATIVKTLSDIERRRA